MSLKLNSSGGGSVTLQEPVTASTLTLTLPAFSGTAATLASVANNGVLFVNSSGQPTSGSALTFDGTGLSVTGSTSATLKLNGRASDNASSANFYDNTGATRYGFLYFDASNAQIASANTTPLAFLLNGSEQMRLTSTGLGIGTNNPAYKLVVSAAGASGLEFGPAYSGTANLIQSYNRSGGAYVNTVYDAANHVYSVSGTERMRIDSSGNLLVGTTSAPANRGALIVRRSTTATTIGNFFNDSTDPYGVLVNYAAAAPNDASHSFFYGADNVTNRFFVYSNGGIANYQGNNVNLSDRREKTNFAPAKSYLETICAIPVQTFNYADQNMEEDPGLTLGVVAQDVQAVAPELVMESNWGTKEEPKMRLSIYQTDLQYALMKALQEQQAMIAQLQADIASLKGTA